MNLLDLFSGIGGFHLGLEQSDTQRYKQLGNAVSVPVVKAVGERLLSFYG